MSINKISICSFLQMIIAMLWPVKMVVKCRYSHITAIFDESSRKGIQLTIDLAVWTQSEGIAFKQCSWRISLTKWLLYVNMFHITASFDEREPSVDLSNLRRFNASIYKILNLFYAVKVFHVPIFILSFKLYDLYVVYKKIYSILYYFEIMFNSKNTL